MNINWVEWVGRGMQLALAVVVVGGVYGMATEASRKQDALCDVAQEHAGNLDRLAVAQALGVSLKRYEEATYAVAMSEDLAKIDKLALLESTARDRIPAEVRREIEYAEEAASEACARPDDYQDY
ncbi:hypothetical protein WHX55_22640 [Pseudomonas fluorescens]|uniref:hypothetical protein n=1 Tax=Pseudomonas fluorescens TaxID=294 RepID=UPI00324F2296